MVADVVFVVSEVLGEHWDEEPGFPAGERLRPSPFPGTESIRSFIAGVVTTGNDPSMESILAGVALKSGVLASEDCIKAECYHFLEKSNRYEMKNEQLEKLKLEKDTILRRTSICILDKWIKNSNNRSREKPFIKGRRGSTFVCKM